MRWRAVGTVLPGPAWPALSRRTVPGKPGCTKKSCPRLPTAGTETTGTETGGPCTRPPARPPAAGAPIAPLFPRACVCSLGNGPGGGGVHVQWSRHNRIPDPLKQIASRAVPSLPGARRSRGPAWPSWRLGAQRWGQSRGSDGSGLRAAFQSQTQSQTRLPSLGFLICRLDDR